MRTARLHAEKQHNKRPECGAHMDNAWRIPSELPDLRRVGITAIDTEVKDAGLAADRGSSWPWRDGYVCGISIAYHVDDQMHSFYFPIRRPDTQNFPPNRSTPGSRITLPPVYASSHKTDFMIGDGSAPKPIFGCHRVNAPKRSARSPQWWTKIAIDMD